MVQRAPWASNGPNHLGLCALQHIKHRKTAEELAQGNRAQDAPTELAMDPASNLAPATDVAPPRSTSPVAVFGIDEDDLGEAGAAPAAATARDEMGVQVGAPVGLGARNRVCSLPFFYMPVPRNMDYAPIRWP